MHLQIEHRSVQQSESLTLEGWVNPLPLYLVEAVDAGVLVICEGKLRPLRGAQDRRTAVEGFQYLQGTVVNPQGTVISFQ